MLSTRRCWTSESLLRYYQLVRVTHLYETKVLDTLSLIWKCWGDFKKEFGTLFWVERGVHWTSKDIPWGAFQKSAIRERRGGMGFWFISICASCTKNVDEYVKDKDNLNLTSRADTPMQTLYWPGLYVSMDLSPVLASYYMSLIGIPRWIVELGRVDICLEVSVMSSHMAIPRQGYLYQALSIFEHLNNYHNTEMVFDPSNPVIDERKFYNKIGHQVNLYMLMGLKHYQ